MWWRPRRPRQTYNWAALRDAFAAPYSTLSMKLAALLMFPNLLAIGCPVRLLVSKVIRLRRANAPPVSLCA
jgi:hypothetical protein